MRVGTVSHNFAIRLKEGKNTATTGNLARLVDGRDGGFLEENEHSRRQHVIQVLFGAEVR